ncbi:hypothetical protein PMAYCL1PPCAC_22433, partial [Pristionchus mayeri]
RTDEMGKTMQEPRESDGIAANPLAKEKNGAEENPMRIAEEHAEISLNSEPPKDKSMEVKKRPMAKALSPSATALHPLPVVNGVMRMCYLCGAMVSRSYATPPNPLARADFLARVIFSKKSFRHSVKALGRNATTAYFCVEHIRTSVEIPQEKQ